jgi:hypothetical protein
VIFLSDRVTASCLSCRAGLCSRSSRLGPPTVRDSCTTVRAAGCCRLTDCSRLPPGAVASIPRVLAAMQARVAGRSVLTTRKCRMVHSDGVIEEMSAIPGLAFTNTWRFLATQGGLWCRPGSHSTCVRSHDPVASGLCRRWSTAALGCRWWIWEYLSAALAQCRSAVC